ncbi:hypothetical protein PG990_011253 [Apiospora arundinis]
MELEDAEASDSDGTVDEAGVHDDDGEQQRQETPPAPSSGGVEHPERPPYRGMSPPPLSFYGEEGLAEERRIKEEVAREIAAEAEKARKRPKPVRTNYPPGKAPKDTFPTQADLELARPIIGVLKQMARWYDEGEYVSDDEILRAAIHETAAEERVNSVFAGMLKQDRRLATFRAFQKAALQVPYSHGFEGDGSKLARAILAAMPMPGHSWQRREKRSSPYQDAATSPTMTTEEESRASDETIQQLTDEKKELEVQLNKLQGDAQDSDLAMQQLISEKASLEEKLREFPDRANGIIMGLTNEKKSLEEKLKQYQDAAEETEKTIARLDSEKGYIMQELKKCPDGATETIQRLTNQKKDLEAKLELDKQAFEAELESQRRDFEEKLKASQEDSQGSTDIIQLLTSEKQDLYQKLKTCQDDAQKSGNVIKKLTSAKKSLEEKLEKATEDDGSDVIIRQLADEKADLDEELERANYNIQELMSEARDLESRLEDERQEHEAELQSQKQGHEKGMAVLRGKFKNFINETDEDRRAMDELHARHAEAMKSFEKERQVVEDAVSKLENEKKDVKRALAAYKAKNATLREEVQGLQQEIEKSKKLFEDKVKNDEDNTELVNTSPEKAGYGELLRYYTRMEDALKLHKSDLEEASQLLLQAGGDPRDLHHVQANMRARWDETKGDDGETIEEFAELAEHLHAAIVRLHVDDQLLRALTVVSLDYQDFGFAELAAAAAGGSSLSSSSSLAMQQRLLGGANKIGPLGWLNAVSFLFFVAATLAEGSKYAQWAAANATSRALFAENRHYACVSAPHMTFVADMARDLLGIRRSS